MQVIYKYQLDGSRTGDVYQEIEVPACAVLLSVQWQQWFKEMPGKICLWFLCNPNAPTKDTIEFYIYRTGKEYNQINGKHVGTVQTEEGEVWHVFMV